jgi:threonine synthase
MDIQVPSNLERLTGRLGEEFAAGWVGDDEIRATIATVHAGHGYVLDPHSAVAWEVGARFPTERPQLVVATAHPAKFADVVGEATGVTPRIPDRLRHVTTDPERVVTIDADPSSLLPLVR